MCRFGRCFSESEQSALLTLVVEIGADRDVALSCLLQSRWSMEEAVDLYLSREALAPAERIRLSPWPTVAAEAVPAEPEGEAAVTPPPRPPARARLRSPPPPEAELNISDLLPSPTRSAEEAPPLEQGYLVIRAPPAKAHLRGIHRVSWAELMLRLGRRTDEKEGWCIRHYDEAWAPSMWGAARLRLPSPIHR